MTSEELLSQEVTGTTNRLLQAILRELVEAKQPVRPTAEGTEVKCKVCGEAFENKGKYLAHMRKHKKEV